ncbi:retrovirus-related pol polyprotein from transposon TNT 1-94 [Tanacetum coccineum]
MANLSEDIQCAGSDTRPPMLDRTDFASWQQRIRLYCRGKENGVNILKSIDEGPFQMGTIRDTIAEGTEGAQQLGPERARVYSDLSPEDKDRYNADIRATNILLQGLPKDIYTLINHYTKAKDIWDNVKMLLEGSELTKEDRESQLYDDFEHFHQNKGETIHDYYNRGQGNNTRGAGAAGYGGAQNRVGNANPGQARQIKSYNCNGIGHIARNCTQSKRPQNSKYFKDKMLLMQAKENGVALDEEQLLFIAGRQDTAVNEDVDEQPVQDLALNVDNMFQASRQIKVLTMYPLNTPATLVPKVENEKVKQHYKELYDSIKTTRAKHIEQTTALLTDNENLKPQIHENLKCITMDSVKPRTLAPGRYAIDVEPISPYNRNNREVHVDYLKHLKESVETLREIVEEAKVERPLDSSLAFVCLYTKHSQEQLEYVIGTCPKDFNQ